MKPTPLLVVIGCLTLLASPLPAVESPQKSFNSGRELSLIGRTQQQDPSGQWSEQTKQLSFVPSQSAIIICDLWDKHWCAGATRRCDALAKNMAPLIDQARAQGVRIVHCPSDTMKFYAGTPERQRILAAPSASPPAPIGRWRYLEVKREGELPIDDADGGCDCQPPCKTSIAWTHEHPAIRVLPGDVVSDNGQEVFNYLTAEGVKTIFYVGVHLNMCVLGRSFGIRQMTDEGFQTVLVRDLTDTMYNPRSRPFVDHDRGTQLMIEHVQRHWSPTVTSAELALALGKKPRIVFIIGEDEYHTWESLPAFARAELEPQGLECAFIQARSDAPNDFPGLEALSDADLVVLSVRRRAPTSEQLAKIRAYLDAGRPLVGIRTASHAFEAKQVPPGHENWSTFDVDVLGAKYLNHYGATLKPVVRPIAERREHPILAGIADEPVLAASSLYKSHDLAATTTPLLIGRLDDGTEEPVAWTNEHCGGRVFYTSLGAVDDFQLPMFRKLLVNAIGWTLEKPVPEKPMSSSGAR